MSTGTSTRGPMTVAKATADPMPNTPIATAIASSKLFDAAVNEKGGSPRVINVKIERDGKAQKEHDEEVKCKWNSDAHDI